ncbi:MAG TPA: radical SAM protein [bacterium]|nr:radical SAM protein [bacterium]
MKVLLLNPPARGIVIRDYYCSKSTKSNYLFQPIDLLMQSGVLAQAHELAAVDAVARRMTREACFAELERIRPDAVLGLWGAVSDTQDREFYAALAGRSPAPIFITGEVFLDDPEKWLRAHPFISGALLCFVSEGLATYLDTGAPGPDLMARKGDEIIGGLDPAPPSEFLLGRPRHELFGHDGYRFSFARGRRFATVLTDFGCPFKCGFCVMAGLGYRMRPEAEVAAEWKWLKERGVAELFVTDQCFGASRERSLELCARLGREAPAGFTTFTRADLLDDALLAAMKGAGCHTVIMGVETADAAALKSYHKGLSLERVKDGFARCRRMKVRTVATFIIGLPEDTEESLAADMRLARELDPDFVSYNVAVPRGGTLLQRIAEAEGLAAAGVDPDQGGGVVAMRTRALSREDVARLKRRAIRDFYLRPRYLARRSLSVRSLAEFLAEAGEGLELIRKNL